MIQPTLEQFTKAQEASVNILKEYSKELDTKNASVIHQLIIRPFAYLYARINQYIDSFIESTSIKYLQQSQLTQNTVADAIASNYFVTRIDGAKAKGILTITSSSPELRISVGTAFLIDSYTFVTEKTILATSAPLESTDKVTYVKTYPIQGKYLANIPVVAVDQGYVEIPQGVQCTASTYIAGFQSATVTSPITGGNSSQTDASMIQRCKDRASLSIGTKGAINTRLYESGLPFINCSVLSSNQPGNFRSRNNNMAIATGGMVDVYVKTANQSSFKQVYIQQLSKDNTGYYIALDSKTYPELAGLVRITQVKPSQQSTSFKYKVTYSSNNSLYNAADCRGSVYQTVRIDFPQITASQALMITVEYMPNIKAIQTYINDDSQNFLGQDILIKSGVPATLNIQGQIYSPSQISQQRMANIKQMISEIVCQNPIGTYKINMDKVAQAVQTSYTDIKLRLPYTIGVSLPTTNGDLYTFNTSDGTVDLSFRQTAYTWDKAAYFFTTNPSYINLQVI